MKNSAKKYYWLKLKEDFFEDDTIAWMEEQENGVYYSNFYLKLCLRSLKSNGVLIRNVGEICVPYDIKKLSAITHVKIDTAIVAMELFKKIGLIKVLEHGEIYLPQLNDMVGSETSKASLMRIKRKQEKEEKQMKSLETDGEKTCGNNVTSLLPKCYTEKDIDIETEQEKDTEINEDIISLEQDPNAVIHTNDERNTNTEIQVKTKKSKSKDKENKSKNNIHLRVETDNAIGQDKKKSKDLYIDVGGETKSCPLKNSDVKQKTNVVEQCGGVLSVCDEKVIGRKGNDDILDNVCKSFVKYGFKLNKNLKEFIKKDICIYGSEYLIDAAKECFSKEKCNNFGYLKGILENWQKRGYAHLSCDGYLRYKANASAYVPMTSILDE